MRILVVGATGAIGRFLIPQLSRRGHEVIGTYASPGGADKLRGLGARPVQLDLLDRAQTRAAVVAAEPDVIVHQATALANERYGRNLDKTFARTNRLRIEGTDSLIDAAADAGVTRIVGQSFASYRYARTGSWVKTEDAPLDPAPAKGTEQTNAAMRHLEELVLACGGIVLRYGGFYGAPNDGLVAPVRKRLLPIVGNGAGISSFIHLYDAAAATVLAVEASGPAIYNIVDDEPAPVRVWLPGLADALGAKPPRHLPRGLARLVGGENAVVSATEARGASNARAKRELGWTLRYPSWREGFRAAYGTASLAPA